MADVRISWVQFDTNATPCDVKVSHLAFDTQAETCDVKVSWLAFNSDTFPCDVRVSWVRFDTQAEAGTEEGRGLFPAVGRKESRRLAAFRRNVAEQQALEQRLAQDRQAQIEADKQAELDRIEQERQRVASIIDYKAPIVSPVISDIQQDYVEIAPELLQKLDLIAKSAKAIPIQPVVQAVEDLDYSDDIALIMLLLEAA